VRENPSVITNTGNTRARPGPTGTALSGNHRSHWAISPGRYEVFSTGSRPRYSGRNTATLARKIDEECSQPTRWAITVAGILGYCANNARIAGSNASTNDPAGLR
jgi:hypothetical protein